MKNESLMFIFDIVFDFCQKLVGKIAVMEKTGAILEIDDGDMGVESRGFGLGGELDERAFRTGEVIVGEVRGGSAEDTGDF